MTKETEAMGDSSIGARLFIGGDAVDRFRKGGSSHGTYKTLKFRRDLQAITREQSNRSQTAKKTTPPTKVTVMKRYRRAWEKPLCRANVEIQRRRLNDIYTRLSNRYRAVRQTTPPIKVTVGRLPYR